VVIAWNNATAGVGSVSWGRDTLSLTNVISESSANQIHAITISSLQPNTKYYYQATCGNFQSAVEYFYTAKPDSVRQLDFVVYGDCGFDDTQEDEISALMATQNQDFGLVVGDVDQLVGAAYDVDYFQHYTNILKHTCHFTAIGNHDIITNNTNYVDAFVLPHNNPDSSELYYSFTWGNALFIALDGNIDYTAGSDQYNWLQSQLQCNNYEWTFVFFHQPPWTDAWDITYYIPFTPFYLYQGNTDMRTSIVPLFEQYHVDVVLNGHAHDYQRGSYNGVNYFIAGGGGTSDPDSHTNSNAPNIQYEQDINNYMKFSINSDTARYYAYNIEGAVFDSGVFTKSFTPYHASISATGANAEEGTLGSAVITVTGPEAPYTFSWSNGSKTDSAVQLSGGNYYVTITNANGCLTNDSVNIQQVALLSIHGTSNNATCPNADNGSITGLQVSGGIPPYAYSWSNVSPLNALSPGVYTLTVTDSLGFSVAQTFTIGANGGNSQPVISIQTGTNIICKGDSLILDASAGFVSYNWSNGFITENIAVNKPGAYSLQVTDSFGCVTSSDTLIINLDSVEHLSISVGITNLHVSLTASSFSLQSFTWDLGNGTLLADTGASIGYTYPDSGTYTIQLITKQYCGNDTVEVIIDVFPEAGNISITATANNATCPGANNGSISDLNISGGNPPYTYLWSTISPVDSLLPGTYSITVTDSLGFTATQSFDIAASGGGVQPVINVNGGGASVICKGDSVQLNATAGFSTYSWSNGADAQSIFVSAAGAYSVQVTDAFGCLTNSDMLILTADSIQHLSIDAAVEYLNVNLSASNTALQSYTWDLGNGVILNDTVAAIDYTYPDSGTYMVQLITKQACGNDTVSISVDVVPQINYILIVGTVSNATCPYSNNGSITGLAASGGTPPYIYTWPANFETDSLLPGTYTVTVTDSLGFSASQSFIISANGGNLLPVISLQGYAGILCQGDSLLLSVTQGFVMYNWSNGGHGPNTYARSAGAYSVQVTDSFGCIAESDTVNLVADSIQHLTINAVISELTVSVTASNSSFETYSWNMGNGAIFSDTYTSITYTYPDSGTYAIQLVSQQYCGNDTAVVIADVSSGISGILNFGSDDLKITVSPNPFHDATHLTLSGTNLTEYKLELYDAQGKLLRNLGQTRNGIFILQKDNLSAGEYLLLVNSGQSKATLKLIVQ
jgi:PKD repeat protein